MDSLDYAILGVFGLLLVVFYSRTLLWSILRSFSSDDTFKVSNSSGSRDVRAVMQENGKNFLVVYGSQTGTAEDYAKKFAKELVGKFPQLNVLVADLEDYDWDEQIALLGRSTPLALFMATYGEGDFPDPALPFERFLQDQDGETLKGLYFTLFGLGNSTYEFFNAAARNTQKMLTKAGAQQVGKFGMADDGAATTDEDYLSWKELIMEDLKDFLQLNEQDVVFRPAFDCQWRDSVSDDVYLGELSANYLPTQELPYNEANSLQTGPFSHNYPYLAPITTTFELFAKGNDRNCIHSEFDISGSNLKYSTGDHLGVFASNPTEKVDQFLRVLSLDANRVCELRPLDATTKVPFPSPTTIEAAVRYYLEITGPVSRQFFSMLVQYAPTETTKQKLLDLSKDKDLFASEITSKYFNIADALSYLSHGEPWTTVPWSFLIENIPRLQPRYYSISSSALSEKQTIHITAIVENMTIPDTKEHVVGVTTNMLRNIQLSMNKLPTEDIPVHYDLDGPRSLYGGHKLPIFVRKSPFKLPTNSGTPIIMVGPGTGAAPFRGFIRERVALAQREDSNVTMGPMMFFYGSRNESDYLYRDEWTQYATVLGESFQMFVAHSRLPGEPKVYVQDKLKEQESRVLDLLKAGAFIYVCGDAKAMAKDVSATFVGILSRGMSISTDEAAEMVKMYKNVGKYQEDVW
ncbi:NADPH--hemoprotein reductase KNAG_0B04840 [Huiozyma naganishii CBS 8797]|uniref:NADPH--cytochrome P450 reductase n=1 Tax=Huiozyma naganishii (strain ATCC MYA-139 / BCRC 22969 / CBS 8797 / KCTC 17520 / NBRC 10181 / NCYC 3082 / Yp74L-3) TaxID=1071383 RepID=J7RHA4_HUIN7|nr:hypothetical protein KNAG_0B04840 [Kazachstania naganishii CBS 8797]CCK68918.1 hypothetical protein KNAG_0B04840 [Kazachstania naganishii CBS 8797]